MLKVLRSLLSHDDLWLVFKATIESVLLYCTQLFGIFSCDVRTQIERLFRRARKVICKKNCDCVNKVTRLNSLRREAFMSLFLKSQNVDHPLFHIVPHIRTHNNRALVPFCKSSKKQNCYTVLASLIFNDLSDLTCIPT